MTKLSGKGKPGLVLGGILSVILAIQKHSTNSPTLSFRLDQIHYQIRILGPFGMPTTVPLHKGTVSDSTMPKTAVISTLVNGSTNATSAMVTTNAPPVRDETVKILHPPRTKLDPDKPDLATPVNPKVLNALLSGYPEGEKDFLVQGFTYGFRIPFKGEIPPLCQKNLQSALQHPSVIDNKLEKEIQKGRIAGPFTAPPFQKFIVSPIGVVPKKCPGEYRVIHHESYPPGQSVNDGIPKDLSSVQYATLQNAIANIKSFGSHCFFSKN